MNIDKGLIRHWANLCENVDCKTVDEGEWSDDKRQRAMSNINLQQGKTWKQVKDMVLGDESGRLMDLMIMLCTSSDEGRKSVEQKSHYLKTATDDPYANEECKRLVELLSMIGQNFKEFSQDFVNGKSDLEQDDVYESRKDAEALPDGADEGA